MIGQSFAPVGGQGKPRVGPGGQNAGAQQAIKVLNLRMPRVVGGGAPAPQPLLTSPGSGAIPTPGGQVPGITPGGAPGGGPPMAPAPFGLEEIIKQLFGLPGAGSAPGAPMPPEAPKPRVDYVPLPGGTAGPNPHQGPMPNPRRDNKNPNETGSDQGGFRRPF